RHRGSSDERDPLRARFIPSGVGLNAGIASESGLGAGDPPPWQCPAGEGSARQAHSLYERRCRRSTERVQKRNECGRSEENSRLKQTFGKLPELQDRGPGDGRASLGGSEREAPGLRFRNLPHNGRPKTKRAPVNPEPAYPAQKP